MKEKKYELIKEDIIKIDGHILYRIGALKDFSNIKKGDIGGYIEKEENLSHEGNCWVYDDAKVYDNARVSGNAIVYDKAIIFGNATIENNARIFANAKIFGNAIISRNANISSNADYTVIQGFGTEYRATTFYKCKDNTIRVNCGCFNGTLEEFKKQVKKTREGKVMEEYLTIADFMENHFKE